LILKENKEWRPETQDFVFVDLDLVPLQVAEEERLLHLQLDQFHFLVLFVLVQ
jgi:hypothetical protein